MSTVISAAHRELGRGFSNETQYAKLTWDFALDGGATADEVHLATAVGKVIILSSLVHVETQPTSATEAAILTIGLDGADELLGASFAADLVADTAIQESAGQGVIVAEDAAITLTIADEDATAGRIHVLIRYVNSD
jgi:hypothetical protein